MFEKIYTLNQMLSKLTPILSIVVALLFVGMSSTTISDNHTEQSDRNAIVDCLLKEKLKENSNQVDCLKDSEFVKLANELKKSDTRKPNVEIEKIIDKRMAELKASKLAKFEEIYPEPKFYPWRIPWGPTLYDFTFPTWAIR